MSAEYAVPERLQFAGLPTDARPGGGCAGSVLLAGFVGTTLPNWLAERLRSGLAGVCLFGTNVSTLTQLRSLTDDIREANPLAIIAIDEEGGDVTRLFEGVGSPYPGNAILGHIDDPDYTASIARSVGARLLDAGCLLDFAPDVDINCNPNNPVIGVRSFGAEPALVARHSTAWVRSLEETGVAASAKHFPGHGDTAEDSHLALPVIDRTLAELRSREFVPFAAAIAAGVRSIMTSHILVPRVDAKNPATFSKVLLTEVLRGELGFDGVIVSDALDMAGASGDIGIPLAAVRALAAGCDLLCIGTANTDAQLAAIESAISDAVVRGEIESSRLADAARRNRSLAEHGARIIRSHRREEGELAVVGELPDADDLSRVATAFEIREGLRVAKRRSYVVFETAANIAIGDSPWGVAAAGAEVTVLREGDLFSSNLFTDTTQLILLGKANHRYQWVRSAVDRFRGKDLDVIVVDMGWPADDRAYADIATFGASRLVGSALLVWFASNAEPEVTAIQKGAGSQ